MMRDFIFTSTSVLPGHPDKLCDRISDALVDAYLTQNPESRVAAECAIASDIVFIVCHASPGPGVDHSSIAREVIREVGYRAPVLDPDRVAIMINLGTLPPPTEDGLTASNNATLFGYACRQTTDFMPAPIALAHGIARGLWNGGQGGVGPDGQVQVSLQYRDRRPAQLTGLTVLADIKEGQDAGRLHLPQTLLETARSLDIVPCDDTVRIDINPPGSRLVGGPTRHPGLTGRKLATDTYGDFSRQGSSALSGKDVSRIDRIGVYAARYAAKNVVAAGLADECEIQLSYSVGTQKPISIQTDTFGTGRADDARITRALQAAFDFRPAAIIERFDLARLPQHHRGVFYRTLSAFGQIGGDRGLPWEDLDLAAEIEARLG